MSFRHLNIVLLIGLFYPLLLQPSWAYAERVKVLNPKCDVCPVVIAYEGSEAVNLIGEKGRKELLSIVNTKQKTTKLDFDGLKRVGSERDSDKGYELVVYSSRYSITINSIQDQSSIKITADYNRLKVKKDKTKWAPEIHLKPSIHLDIMKDDNIEAAWNIMKGTKIYKLINNNKGHEKWHDNFKKMILYVLEEIRTPETKK